MDPIIFWTEAELKRELKVLVWEGSYWALRRAEQVREQLRVRAEQAVEAATLPKFLSAYADSFAA